MKRAARRLLFWSPRILTILFALFLSLFALDVFDEGHGFLQTLLALMIHLVPTWIVVATLVVSWRWEWVGTVLFVVLGLLYVPFAVRRGHLEWALIISGPLFLVAGLFLLNWVKRREIRAASKDW